MTAFEKNERRAASVNDLIHLLGRRSHHGLDEAQRVFVAHCIRYYGQSRTTNPGNITADKVGQYSPEYVLKTLLLCEPNLNTEGKRVMDHVCHKIEVSQEIVWACTGSGDLPVVDPIWISLCGRIRLHAMVRAIKDAGEGKMTLGTPAEIIGSWAARCFPVENRGPCYSIRKAIQHCELFGPEFHPENCAVPHAFPDAVCETYWPALAGTDWTTK